MSAPQEHEYESERTLALDRRSIIGLIGAGAMGIAGWKAIDPADAFSANDDYGDGDNSGHGNSDDDDDEPQRSRWWWR